MTATAKHTPGPWIQDQCRRIKAKSGKEVLFSGLTLTAGNHPDQQEAAANTRLAAAAPDLLATCKDVMERHESGSIVLTTLPLERLRAAIAKAEAGSMKFDMGETVVPE